MYRSSAKRLSAFIVSVGFFLAGTSALVAAQQASAPKVRLSVKNRTSAPLRDYQMTGPVVPQPPREVKNKNLPPKSSRPGAADPVVQRSFGLTTPAELGQFEGGSDDDNEAVIGGRIAPPDTNGDIGPSHYVQYINLIVTMYDRDGNIELGPLPGNAFWDGFGDICETSNDGDPIVLYDQLADRWFVSQFALPGFPSPPYVQCVAVSVTGDPTGAYHQYQFNLPDTYLNDYPKFGVWPDGYYMSFNGFDFFGGGFQGAAIAMDRAAMLDGDPATMIQFDTGAEGGVLPSDMDGTTLPPGGSPNYFVTYEVAPERLLIWQFHADFATPLDNTFTGPVEVLVAPFVTPVCGSSRDQCVPQLDSPELLETLSQATMFRLAYRNFGDHESLVTNHTVDAGGEIAGIRWYEIRNPGGTALGNGGATPPLIHQQGTFAPDSNYRWMGSIAQDANGNMALGYSISSESMYPSIAITGRLEGDPLGTMGAEDIFLAGTGSQIDTVSRWGDYSSMSVDPLDDCTFWYTQQYYQETGNFDWNTRVASFKYPGCLAPGTGTISGTVTDGTNPIAGAKVTAGSGAATTDASGQYSITLPIGTYDMTASKYGYFPASANDVEVTDGGNTIQDFELSVAPSIEVNGTVKDGSGGGWPLYANIKITGPGAPTFNILTDPVTGYYSIVLVQGLTYTFEITSVGPGYLPGGGTVDLPAPPLNAPGGLVRNWTLLVDADVCNAPGYTLNIEGLNEGFEGGGLPAGWEITNETGNDTWYINIGPDPDCGDFAGNLTGGTGYYAVVNSDCAGFVSLDTSLVTSSVDMSSLSAAQIRFNSDYRHYDVDVADVDISVDGGTSWTNVWQQTANARGPRVESIDITSLAAGEADVKARFHYYDAFFAWWWQVDNVILGNVTCDVGSGGLVIGKVTSLETGQGLNGATVKNLPDGGETQTFNAAGKGDGFYILFAESGNQQFEASMPLYGSVQKSTLVVPNATQRLDFALPSGVLSAAPTPLNGRADPGDTDEQILTLTNTGSAPASFVISELDMPATPAPLNRPRADKDLIAAALARIPKSQDKARSTQGLPQVSPPDAPEAAGGAVIASYPSDLTFGWGVASDTGAGTFWISNIAAGGGDDLDYEFNAADGAQTGNTIDDTTWVDAFAADGAYNHRTGMLWRVNVGADTCIYELDPVNHVATGNRICPDFGTSERGLAYDPVTDTFWAGSWNDLAIQHFDTSGNILDGAAVGIPVSGLAYNPRSGNLYAMQNAGGGIDVWILEAATYNITGFFAIKENGSPVITPFGGAGIDPDCDGNLWVIDQNTQTIYLVASGETNWCVNEVTWLSEDPTEGTVAAGSVRQGGGSTLDVTVTYDSTGLNPGLRQAQLIIQTDTPNPVPPVPVNFTVRFLDVPDSNQFEAFIYGAAGAGIMTGCGANNFCPDGIVTRADMAGYIERAMKGADYLGSPYLGGFSDVSQQTPNANYIQALVDDGITAGCGTGIYCPNNPNTRAQMAVFIVKATEGAAFVPPACTGIFGDVPCPGGFAVDFIEYLFNQGVTGGCGGGNYCPTANISNGQMAVFLVKAFNVPHL